MALEDLDKIEEKTLYESPVDEREQEVAHQKTQKMESDFKAE